MATVNLSMRTFRLYLALLGAALRGQMQYRANLFLMTIGGLAYQGAGFVFIWVVLDRFGSIGGWTLGEVAFLYGVRLCAHGVMVCFFNQLTSVDEVIREGEFDRYLVRPLNPLLQMLTRRMMLSAFGDLFGGCLLVAVSATMVPIDWSAPAIAYLVLAIGGGALVEAAVQLAFGSLGFRLLSTGGLRFVGDDLFNLFGGYPLKIFPTAARFVLTFVMPLAFVAYLPVSVLLGRTGELSVPAVVGYLAPLLGGVLLFAAYRLWRHQMQFYTSSGH